jgi:hypothetical protein
MFKRFASIFLMFIMLFSLVISASADGSDPGSTPSHGNGQIFGVVPPKGKANAMAAATNFATSNLTYHSGAVMHSNTTHTIFWVPSGYSVNSSYISLINHFLIDVAAADNVTSNVYYSDKQYYSVSGGVKYYITTTSTFGGAYLDTNPYPVSGCAPYMTGMTECLTDAQIQAEIQRVITLKGWASNSTTEFFMFTANNVGSQAGSYYAFNDYCAYHSWFGSVLYANMPYTGFSLSSCGVPQSPNGNWAADSTISVLSHEHNETITDPRGTGWYDGSGNENGDKCAWRFGSVSSSLKYNQTINGHHYILQKEWSNSTARCVLSGW